mgnify:CR=1 FL=1
MLPIRGNALGLAMLVVTGAIAAVGGLVLQLGDALVMIAVGGALIVMDLAVRWRVRPAPGWLMQSHAGGYLFFVPVWVAGGVVILINVINALVA